VASLVTAGTPGKHVIVLQRAVEEYPLTNCRLVDATRQLVFGGVAVPDRRRLIRVWREATGVPEVAGDGSTQGTTAADLLRGASAILPWVPFAYGPWDDDALLSAIERGFLTFTAGVSYPALPKDLRRFSPSFRGKHAAGVAKARQLPTGWDVWWVDGLRTDGAEGEWVRWSTIKRALDAAGMVTRSGTWGLTLERGAAMSTSVISESVYSPPATVTIPKGTTTWSQSKRTLRLAAEKPTQAAQTVSTTTVVAVLSKPDIPGVPDTKMVRIESGPRAGQFVKLRDVKLVPAPAPGDCQPLIDAAVQAATAPLVERLAEWETARTAHDLVAFPDPVL
jgi:hypothetical protein